MLPRYFFLFATAPSSWVVTNAIRALNDTDINLDTFAYILKGGFLLSYFQTKYPFAACLPWSASFLLEYLL